MSSITSIALSGMQAARERLNIASDNIANAATVGALSAARGGGAAAYAPQRVNQQSAAGGGVATSLSSLDPAILTTYQPDSSAADRTGLEAAPNVDLASEVINQKSALQAYEASALLVRVAGQLDRTLLDGAATKPRHSVRV
jgi:flagellar basal-body rod protein FlgC